MALKFQHKGMKMPYSLIKWHGPDEEPEWNKKGVARIIYMARNWDFSGLDFVHKKYWEVSKHLVTRWAYAEDLQRLISEDQIKEEKQ